MSFGDGQRFGSVFLLLALSVGMASGCEEPAAREEDPAERLVATDDCPMPEATSLEEAIEQVEAFISCHGFAEGSVQVSCEAQQYWFPSPDLPDGVGGVWTIGQVRAVCRYTGETVGTLVLSMSSDTLEATGIDRPFDALPIERECSDAFAQMVGRGVASVEEVADLWTTFFICGGRSVDDLEIDCWGKCYTALEPEGYYLCRIIDWSTRQITMSTTLARR